MIGNNQKYYEKFIKLTILREKWCRNKFLGSSPKLLLETIGITIIAILGASIAKKGITSDARALIGFIALGSQKLLPSLQAIYSSWLSLKSTTSSIVNVVKLLNLKEPKINNGLNNDYFKQVIELKNVSFRYEKNKPLILNNVNLKIKYGEKIGIIGRTGSGKSTLIDLLMTLIGALRRKFLIDGKDIYDKNSKIQSLIGDIKLRMFLY